MGIKVKSKMVIGNLYTREPIVITKKLSNDDMKAYAKSEGHSIFH